MKTEDDERKQEQNDEERVGRTKGVWKRLVTQVLSLPGFVSNAVTAGHVVCFHVSAPCLVVASRSCSLRSHSRT